MFNKLNVLTFPTYTFWCIYILALYIIKFRGGWNIYFQLFLFFKWWKNTCERELSVSITALHRLVFPHNLSKLTTLGRLGNVVFIFAKSNNNSYFIFDWKRVFLIIYRSPMGIIPILLLNLLCWIVARSHPKGQIWVVFTLPCLEKFTRPR